MSSEIQEYASYVKTSFKDIIKAITLILLMGSGIFLVILLRLNDVDGWSIFIIGSIVEIIAFGIILFLGKKGWIFKPQRQEELQKTPKKSEEQE